MIKEIYTRGPGDPNFNPRILEHSDPIECIITKIKMILGTKPGQIFGEMKFGVDIENLVFQTNVNNNKLENIIKDQIKTYIPESTSYDIDVKVNFGRADFYDYSVIDIYINKNKVIGFSVK